jgi:hypothetical protein
MYNMKMILLSLCILVVTILLLYLYMPMKCSNIKEPLENEDKDELPYYQSDTPLGPGGEREYYNGIYCKKGDDDCRKYAFTCSVEEDPNCHNFDSKTADCYDNKGNYTCDTKYNPSDYMKDLHDAAGSCRTISGEYICDGKEWGKSAEKWLSFVELDDLKYEKNSSCKVKDGKLVCDNQEINDKIKAEEVDGTNHCRIFNNEIVCDDNVWDRYTPSNYHVDSETRDTHPSSWSNANIPSSALNEWGISNITSSILSELNDINATRASYHTLDNLHENSSCQLINGEIACDYDVWKKLYVDAPPTTSPYSDWNRYLETPTVDTKDYTANADTLNKIFKAIYVIASRNDCSQGIYGCCADKVTAKSDYQGSNCPNQLSLSDEVKQYIDYSVTKTADKMTPPESSTLANAATVPASTKKDSLAPTANGSTSTSTSTNTNTNSNTNSSASTNTNGFSSIDAVWENMNGSTPLPNTTSFLDTNVTPAQTSYTSTVFLAGPKGGIIGNCPEPSYECKKGQCKHNNLPMPVLADFSSFGK